MAAMGNERGKSGYSLAQLDIANLMAEVVQLRAAVSLLETTIAKTGDQDQDVRASPWEAKQDAQIHRPA